MIPKQFRIHAVLLLAALFMIFFPMLNQKPDAEKAEKARGAAQVFFQLVDAEKYAESWQSAAVLMREKVDQEDWVAKLSRTHSLSGDLLERSEKSISYSTTAKDSPDGEYIALVYDSKFQRAATVAEYVTVMLEDGRWVVAGYFVK